MKPRISVTLGQELLIPIPTIKDLVNLTEKLLIRIKLTKKKMTMTFAQKLKNGKII